MSNMLNIPSSCPCVADMALLLLLLASPLPPHIGSHPEARFGHLTIYAATYYSYVYARVLASSTWSKVFADDPLNPEAGGAV
jgi:Zn-dependent oligopeptidase